jgi:uncharacterized protein (TIGR02145 family)
MAENLKYLPSVVGPSTESTTTQYYYVYGYNGTNVVDAKSTANYQTYGVLYNWTAAVGACPTGWHLPTDVEFTELENYLIANGYNYDGTTSGNKISKALASTTLWVSSATKGAVGNTDYPAKRNATGFTALPGGDRGLNGVFSNIGLAFDWWPATEADAAFAWSRYVYFDGAFVSRIKYQKDYGFSVRCLKDK